MSAFVPAAHWEHQTENILRQAKHYFKGDYKLHVKTSSRIADHCSTFALSDPGQESFSSHAEDHGHDLTCDQCEATKAVIADLEEKTMYYYNQASLDEADVHDMRTAKVAIEEWKKHALRSVHQDLSRTQLFANLRPDTEVTLVLDWAMKWLPMSGREEQTQFYGKRGLSWHITVAFMKTRDPQVAYQKRTFVHVFDSVTQDGKAVIAILRDVLRRIKAERSQVGKAFIRSDNAGCYHGAESLGYLQQISDNTGVKISRWDFSDPQSGKGPCDRMSAVIKRKVRSFVNENNKCTTAKEFAICVAAHEGVKGTTVVESFFIPKENVAVPEPPMITIAGVSTLNNFQTTPRGLRAWKAFEIGEGREYAVRKNILNVVLLPGVVFNENSESKEGMASYWINVKNTESAEQTPEYDTVDETLDQAAQSDSERGLFSCPIAGCVKLFQRHGDLLNHLDLGNHKFVPERISLRDAAIRSYKQGAEVMETRSSLQSLTDALHEIAISQDYHEGVLMEMGWALRHPRVPTRLSEKQRKFLLEQFDMSEAGGRRFDATLLSQAMRNAKDCNGIRLFSSHEFLKWQQISSFYSAEANRRRKRRLSARFNSELSKLMQNLEMKISKVIRI